MHESPISPGHGGLHPTRLHAAPLRLQRLDGGALAGLWRSLHPALRGARRFVEALLALPPHAARRLNADGPEVWAAARDDDALVVGLGWLAGAATEVIAAPGREHDEATQRLVDMMLAIASARRLGTLTARLAGPFHVSTLLAGPGTRLLSARGGAVLLQLDLTLSPESDNVAS